MSRMFETRRVLIVDDDPDIRDILMQMMTQLHIPSEEASDGKMALEMMKKQIFHAVLCDIMMPEMTGLECLARAQVEGFLTPFVFVTGYGDSDRLLQAIRLGAIDFINKPFMNDEIVDVVFRSLEIGQRRINYFRDLEATHPEIFSQIKKGEKMISLLKVQSNKKRSA